MTKKYKYVTYLPGLLCWMVVTFLITEPVLSYLFAWLGTFFIFYWTLLSRFKFVNDDLPLSKQIMRPIVIVQIIFAGFMCATSIFYFLNHLGYRYFEKVDFTVEIPNAETYLIAECQRLSLLAHATMVTGITLLTPLSYQNKRKYQFNAATDINKFLGLFSLIIFFAGVLFRFIPGINQFSIGLTSLSVFSGSFTLVKGIKIKNQKMLIIGGALFLFNFIQATLSGFKEPIILSIIILGCLLFPIYKKITLYVGVPLLYGLIYILPTYVNLIRTQTWSGEQTAEESRSAAVDLLLDGENEEEVENTNWQFLTERISEIGMFTKFVDSTPRDIDFYGLDIIIDGLYSLIPRILWPEKPITEELSMQRVYAAGVISENSSASAKTRPVEDAYLSFGTFGVAVFFLLFGLFAQYLCNKTENLFGGYQMGAVIMMGTVSDTLWRGNNFEFMFNSIFYGFILILFIHFILKMLKILMPLEFPITENEVIFDYDSE